MLPELRSAALAAVIGHEGFVLVAVLVQQLTDQEDTGNNVALIVGGFDPKSAQAIIVNRVNLHQAPAGAVVCVEVEAAFAFRDCQRQCIGNAVVLTRLLHYLLKLVAQRNVVAV